MKKDKKKTARKPKPSMLGSGMAAMAGRMVSGRGRQIDDQVDQMVRGYSVNDKEPSEMETKKRRKK